MDGFSFLRIEMWDCSDLYALTEVMTVVRSSLQVQFLRDPPGAMDAGDNPVMADAKTQEPCYGV